MLRITNRQRHRPKLPAGPALAYYRRILCNPFLDTCIVQLQENFASTNAKALLISALMPAFFLERDFSAIEEGVTMYLQFLPGSKMAAEVESMRSLAYWRRQVSASRSIQVLDALIVATQLEHTLVSRLCCEYLLPITSAAA